MAEENLLNLAKERVRIEHAEQADRLKEDYDRTVHQFNAQGILTSGMFMGAIAELCANFIDVRAQATWLTLYRFLSTGGLQYSDTLSPKLKESFRELLGDLEDIKAFLAKAGQVSGFADRNEHNEELVETRLNRSLTKIDGEIDLLVHSLRARETAAPSDQSQILNFYSPVGVVQTGPNAFANVTQSIDTEIREQIKQALEKVTMCLSELPTLDGADKDELVEVVTEIVEETSTDRPNTTKIKSLLTAVAVGLQSTAAARPAYEAVKVALNYFGISL